MVRLAEILETIPTLSSEEKQKLRTALDRNNSPPAEPNGRVRSRSRLNGFLADEPELADELLKVIAENRARPFRADDPTP